MVYRDVKVGTRIAVMVESNVSNDIIRLPSIFEADEEDDRFLISAPQLGGALFPLHPGQDVSISITTHSGLMMFPARVESRFAAGKVHFVRLVKTGELQRIQRRRDFRLSFYAPVHIRRQREDLQEEFSAQAMDISGGGLRFLHNEQLHPDDRLTAMFIIDGTAMEFNGRIANIHKAENSPGYKYCTGMEFEYATEAEKDAMIRRLFKLQRARMTRK